MVSKRKRLFHGVNGLLLFVSLIILTGCGLWPERSIPEGKPVVLDPIATATAEPALVPIKDPSAQLPGRIKFERFPLDPDKFVLSLIQDREGFLWFGMEDGLYRYDGYDFKLYEPREQSEGQFGLTSIRVLYEDRLGRIWAAAERGLARFNPVDEGWAWYPQQSDDPGGLNAAVITAIAEDRQGNLWIAMDGSGISRLDPISGEISRFVHRSGNPKSLASDAVTALTASSSGDLWAGTRSGVLERIDPTTGQFTHFRLMQTGTSAGSNRAIEAILEDPAGDLWLSIPGGLLGFDPQMGSFTLFSHGSADVQKVDPSSLVLDSSGSFWLGTYGDGIYRFSPRTGTWMHYQNSPNDAYSLSEDEVAGLLLDRSGILWIYFLSGWVDRFDPSTRPV
jgi:ligand-binding sensor domain-containing protein